VSSEVSVTPCHLFLILSLHGHCSDIIQSLILCSARAVTVISDAMIDLLLHCLLIYLLCVSANYRFVLNNFDAN